MGFLKSIGAAIMSAFKLAGRVATSPLRWLAGFGGGGGGYPALPEPPPVGGQDEPDPVAEREKQVAAGLEMANALMGYCADSVIDDCPAYLPHQLSPEVRQWARGLTRDECVAIMTSDDKAVFAHISGLFRLPNVRGLQSLPTARWEKEPSSDHDDDFDFNGTYAAEPGRP